MECHFRRTLDPKTNWRYTTTAVVPWESNLSEKHFDVASLQIFKAELTERSLASVSIPFYEVNYVPEVC